ncbi:hypothetical protein RRG08_020948, partial [Elysia crispata]
CEYITSSHGEVDCLYRTSMLCLFYGLLLSCASGQDGDEEAN